MERKCGNCFFCHSEIIRLAIIPIKHRPDAIVVQRSRVCHPPVSQNNFYRQYPHAHEIIGYQTEPCQGWRENVS